jgi:hypothetical protein
VKATYRILARNPAGQVVEVETGTAEGRNPFEATTAALSDMLDVYRLYSSNAENEMANWSKIEIEIVRFT